MSVVLVGSGARRGLEVDGRTGEPLTWPKAEAIGAVYGQLNEPWLVMRALLGWEGVKCANARL